MGQLQLFLSSILSCYLTWEKKLSEGKLAGLVGCVRRSHILQCTVRRMHLDQNKLHYQENN